MAEQPNAKLSPNLSLNSTISVCSMGSTNSVLTDPGTTQPPLSPLYYRTHALHSSGLSKMNSRTSSYASLQKYCSSMSIGSCVSNQENVPEFVIPTRKTPPRSERMTASAELVSYIKRNHSRDYHVCIEDEIKKDLAAREREESVDTECTMDEAVSPIENSAGLGELNGHI